MMMMGVFGALFLIGSIVAVLLSRTAAGEIEGLLLMLIGIMLLIGRAILEQLAKKVALVLLCGLLGLSSLAGAYNGEMSFELFRMLSTGMTEGQVLAKAGPPASRFVTSCIITPPYVTCPTIWTYLMGDGWTADLTFNGGRLIDIRQTKTP